MSKGMRFSQEQLDAMLSNNKNLKVNEQKLEQPYIQQNNTTHNTEDFKEFLNKKIKSETKIKIEQIAEKKINTKKTVPITIKINKTNKESIAHINYDNSYIGILFYGARLLSMNQLFNIMQYRPYEMFSYKKIWHEKIQQLLLLQKNLPFFQSAVEITIFRQAPKLVDEDALGTMFKYIIDALKKEHKEGYLGVLSDDNKQIVKRIILQQTKGKYMVGIKIQEISTTYTEDNFQSSNILIKKNNV